MIVDNETALENVKRLGNKLGCDVASEAKGDGTFEILLTRKAGASQPAQNVSVSCDTSASVSGPFVIVISEDKMGRGNDELGAVLIKSFLHCLEKQSRML